MIAPLAALSAAMAVAASAFGAHAAPDTQAAEWLRTGGGFQLAHAIAALALIRWPSLKWSALALLAGSALFGASLYALALGAPRSVAMAAPIGGGLMIGGWLWAAWRLRRLQI
jgi:uncharacterized membrane protein YgdD (TMEM256/DUF423 family)